MTNLLSNILITGAHDFMAPYLFREFQENYPSDTSIWMLGRGDLAGMKVDLATESPVMPAAMDCVIHVDGTDSGSFNAATALDEVRSLARSLENTPPQSMVYISSSIVYGLNEGESIDEKTPLSPTRRDAQAKRDVEGFLTRWCENNGVKLSILRPAMVVGTGMGGELRRLVNSIYRGTYRHVTGNDARVSVVHAVDVARAARMAVAQSGIWNITDGNDPLRHDLVEALAWRLRHKRVYSISQKHARILARIGNYLPVTGFNKLSLKAQLSTLTFDGNSFCRLTGFTPVSVTNYLQTHDYNDSSL